MSLNIKPLKGKVVHGEARGYELGYPTANIDIDPKVLPRKGVYAVRVRIGEETEIYCGAANIGVNPTFGGKIKKLEVHLLDYSGDLYGQTLEIIFEAYLRREKKFQSADALAKQIAKDVIKVRTMLE